MRRCVECDQTKVEREEFPKSNRHWRRRRCRACLMVTKPLAAEALDRFWHDQPQQKKDAA